MALNTRISNVAAIAACNAIVDLLDAAAGSPNNGYVEIRTGAPPTNVDDAATGTLLATMVIENPAFGNAADAAPGGQATFTDVAPDQSADATGTAGWFRAYDGAGTAIIQGTCGTSDADMILATVSIESGVEVDITAWTITMPES